MTAKKMGRSNFKWYTGAPPRVRRRVSLAGAPPKRDGRNVRRADACTEAQRRMVQDQNRKVAHNHQGMMGWI